MDVTIRERKFSLRSEYDIKAPSCTYSAQKKILSLLAQLKVVAEDGRVVARISGRWSFFRARYDFVLADGNKYRFWREKIWKDVFACENNQEKFRMYTHKALNYSIFQNDIQIAAFRRNRVVVGHGNEYGLRINADANLLVIVCMVLALNTAEDSDNDTSVTINLGNIGPEGRPFDSSWEPS